MVLQTHQNSPDFSLKTQRRLALLLLMIKTTSGHYIAKHGVMREGKFEHRSRCCGTRANEIDKFHALKELTHLTKKTNQSKKLNNNKNVR